MNREEFLNALREKLSYLPQDEIEERLAFYTEMIDDRMEEGMTEEEATAAVGTVDQIAAQLMSEVPLSRLVIKKVKSKRKLKAWEVILLVLGSPLWVPLLLAAFCVLLSLYIVLWSLVIGAYAVGFSFAVSAVLSVPCAVRYYLAGNLAGACFLLGAGIALAGLSILMYFACVGITRGVIKLMKKSLLWIKTLFIGKEDADHALA